MIAHAMPNIGRNNVRIAPHVTAAVFGVIALLAQDGAPIAAEVKVMAGAGMRAAFAELVPQFEHATGHKVVIQYAGGATFKKQIEAGEAFDLVIIDSNEVDDLIKQGRIARDTRVDVVRAGIGVAVREGAPMPDISSIDALKDTLLSAKSITYAPEGSTGRHLPRVFDRLGIAEEMKAKTKPNALARVPQAVAAGEVELAISGIPALMSAKGVQILGLLPGELQSWFVNTAGVSTAAKQPDGAKALIKHLATPEAAAVIKAKGMEPLIK